MALESLSNKGKIFRGKAVFWDEFKWGAGNHSNIDSLSLSREMYFLRCVVTGTKVCASGGTDLGGSQTLINIQQRGMGGIERAASGIYIFVIKS